MHHSRIGELRHFLCVVHKKDWEVLHDEVDSIALISERFRSRDAEKLDAYPECRLQIWRCGCGIARKANPGPEAFVVKDADLQFFWNIRLQNPLCTGYPMLLSKYGPLSRPLSKLNASVLRNADEHLCQSFGCFRWIVKARRDGVLHA